MKKDINYFMSLNYPIEIQKISEEEGGGYRATIPQLGKYAFVGDGETIEEAIKNLNEVKKDLFKMYLEKNIPIPEPEKEEDKEFSGRFVLRIPSELHRFLYYEAKRNGTTLNQYCLYLLTRKSYLKNIQDELKEVKEEICQISSFVKNIEYKLGMRVSIQNYNLQNIYKYNQSA